MFSSRLELDGIMWGNGVALAVEERAKASGVTVLARDVCSYVDKRMLQEIKRVFDAPFAAYLVPCTACLAQDTKQI